MTIGAICNRDVITVLRDTTVLEAAKQMRQQHVGDVVVIEAGNDKAKPIGILTDRDIVIELVAPELDCKVMTVGDIMVNNLVSINQSSGIFDAIQTMSAKGIRRLPVVDDAGDLVGIIALDDLLLLLAKELGGLSKLMSREQKNEASKRR